MNKLVDGLSGNLKSKKINIPVIVDIDSLFHDLCWIISWAMGKGRRRSDTAQKRWL